MRHLMAVGIIFFTNAVLTTIWYQITASANRLEFTLAEPKIGLLLFSHLTFALLLLSLFRMLGRGRGTGLRFGAVFGATSGLMMFLPTALAVRGAWDVPVDTMFVLNTAFHTALGALAGILVVVIRGAGHASSP